MIAYIDESGHTSEADFFALAACVGHWFVWPVLQDRWTRALAKHGAPYLHMREFAHFRGAFEGWTEERRRALMNDLLDCLDGLHISIVASSMRVADFESLDPADRQAYIGPTFCCFQEVLRGIQTQSYVDSALAKTDVIYSRQDEYGPELKRLFDGFRRRDADGRILGILEFQDMRASAGLQLADLAAYELRHYHYQRSKNPDASIRVPFYRLFQHNLSVPNPGAFRFMPAWVLHCHAAGIWDAVERVFWKNRDNPVTRTLILQRYVEGHNYYEQLFRDMDPSYWEGLVRRRMERIGAYRPPTNDEG